MSMDPSSYWALVAIIGFLALTWAGSKFHL
jgi:hypothetical protein